MCLLFTLLLLIVYVSNGNLLLQMDDEEMNSRFIMGVFFCGTQV